MVQKSPSLRAILGRNRATDVRRPERIRDVLREAGISADISPDVERELREKFLMALVGLGFLSVNRLPIGPTMACPESVGVVCGLVEEVLAVGRARGTLQCRSHSAYPGAPVFE